MTPQCVVVLARNRLAPLENRLDALPLPDSERTVDFRNPVAVPDLGVLEPILVVAPSLVAKLSGGCRELAVVGDDHSPLSRPDPLVRIQLKDPLPPPPPPPPYAPLRPPR